MYNCNSQICYGDENSSKYGIHDIHEQDHNRYIETKGIYTSRDIPGVCPLFILQLFMSAYRGRLLLYLTDEQQTLAR